MNPNLSLLDAESLVIFLRDRPPLWRAHCEQMGVDADRIVREMTEAYARQVQEQTTQNYN